jgi:hypothetical protein
MRFMKYFITSLAGVTFAGCVGAAEDTTHASSVTVAGSPSDQGIQPTAYPGNFVASDDDQVCYELSRIAGWDATEEMRGFKIDPPTSVTNAGGTFTITQPYLAWEAAANMQVLAVIVKGGPNYNLYDYFGQYFPSDGSLHSPLHKNKLPAISHYNVCYQPLTPPEGDQGCTPGYWRNHADRWAELAPSAGYDATFGITSGLGAYYTLGQAIWANGGGEFALARHATAALLNAHGGTPNPGTDVTVNYPYTVEQVLQLVQDAYAAEDRAAAIEAAKDQLADANELGCPLGGTSASPVQ